MTVNSLKTLAQESSALRLKYLSTECSVYLGEALLNAKDYLRARQELEEATRKSRELDSRALLAKCHYLTATSLHLSGQGAAAASHYDEARRLVEEIHKEAGKRCNIETLGHSPYLRRFTSPDLKAERPDNQSLLQICRLLAETRSRVLSSSRPLLPALLLV